MKKVLTLLTLLCMVCTGAWANDYQPAAGQFIKLHHANTDANWYIGSNELGTSWQKYNSAPTNASDVWQLVVTATEGQFFLFHPYTQTYLGKTDAVGDNQNIPMVQTIEDAGQYKFIAGESTIGSKSYDAFYVRNVLHNDNTRNGLHSTSNVTFVRWESQNNCENSLWLPEVVEDPATTLLNNYKTLATSFKTKCNGHTDNVGQTFYMRNEVKALLDALGNEEPTTYSATKFLGIKANEYNLVVVPAVGTFWYVGGYHSPEDNTRYLVVNGQNALAVQDEKDNTGIWKVIASNQSNGTIQLQNVSKPTYYLNQSGGTIGAYTNGACDVYIGRTFALAQNCVNMCVNNNWRNASSTSVGSSFGYGSNDGRMDNASTSNSGHSTNWKFEAANIVQTVTYTFPAPDGTSSFTSVLDIVNGTDASTSIPSIDYFTATGLEGSNNIVAEDNTTFTVQGTWNFPIPFNRVTRLHGSNHSTWIVYNSATQVDFKSSSDNFEKKNYWYFTYAGMKNGKVLVNMYCLANNNPASVANANNGTNVNFNSATPTNFAITKNSDGFNICHPDNFGARFNKFGGQLKFWTGGNDEDVNNRFHIKTDVFDRDLANVNTIAGVEGSKFLGEAPFAVDAAKKTAAIANPTPENVKAVFTPEVDVNKYYRFKCQDTGRSNNYVYSDIHANTTGEVNDDATEHRLVKSEAETTVVNTLFKFEKEGNAYYIQHVNSGKYFSKSTGDLDLPFYKGSATTYEPTQVDGKWWGIKQTGGNHVHQSNQAHKKLIVWGGLNAEPASNWTIEEVDEIPLTIKTSKWASVCFPVAVTLPDELTAYYAVSVSSNGIGLDALEGKVIPANTPVVITTRENISEATIYTLTIGGEATAPEDNLFTGTTISRQGYNHDTAFNYGLSSGNFVRMTGTTVAANKAFIEAEKDLAPAGSVRVYIFEDTLTGINAATTTAEQGAYYDLNGHFVAYPTTGVYVRNGKKIFVK